MIQLYIWQKSSLLHCKTEDFDFESFWNKGYWICIHYRQLISIWGDCLQALNRKQHRTAVLERRETQELHQCPGSPCLVILSSTVHGGGVMITELRWQIQEFRAPKVTGICRKGCWHTYPTEHWYVYQRRGYVWGLNVGHCDVSVWVG